MEPNLSQLEAILIGEFCAFLNLQNRPLFYTDRQTSHVMMDFLWRTFLLTAGVGPGVITFLPNVMASDSGSPKATRISRIGILASATMVCGGLYGAFSGNYYAILAGYGLQASMFLIMWLS